MSSVDTNKALLRHLVRFCRRWRLLTLRSPLWNDRDRMKVCEAREITTASKSEWEKGRGEMQLIKRNRGRKRGRQLSSSKSDETRKVKAQGGEKEKRERRKGERERERGRGTIIWLIPIASIGPLSLTFFSLSLQPPSSFMHHLQRQLQRRINFRIATKHFSWRNDSVLTTANIRVFETKNKQNVSNSPFPSRRTASL